MEFKNGLTDHNMKDNGFKIYLKEMELLKKKTVILCKDNGIKAKLMALLYIHNSHFKMEKLKINIMENGKMEERMVKALKYGLMELSLKGYTKMIKKME